MRTIVGFLQFIHLITDILKALNEIPYPVDHQVSQSEHLLLILCLPALYPCDLQHPEDSIQVLFTGDENFLIKGITPQIGILVKGCLHSRLVRDEHNHEVERLAPIHIITVVLFIRQLIDMLTHTLHMVLQITATFLICGGVDITDKGRE